MKLSCEKNSALFLRHGLLRIVGVGGVKVVKLSFHRASNQ